MYKYKIELVTTSDILEFVKITTGLSGSVKLIDDSGFCVDGKSLLGVMASIEWSSLYCVSDRPIFNSIEKFCTGGSANEV